MAPSSKFSYNKSMHGPPSYPSSGYPYTKTNQVGTSLHPMTDIERSAHEKKMKEQNEMKKLEEGGFFGNKITLINNKNANETETEMQDLSKQNLISDNPI